MESLYATGFQSPFGLYPSFWLLTFDMGVVRWTINIIHLTKIGPSYHCDRSLFTTATLFHFSFVLFIVLFINLCAVIVPHCVHHAWMSVFLKWFNMDVKQLWMAFQQLQRFYCDFFYHCYMFDYVLFFWWMKSKK